MDPSKEPLTGQTRSWCPRAEEAVRQIFRTFVPRKPTPLEVGVWFAASLLLGRYMLAFADPSAGVGVDLGVFRETLDRILGGGPLYPPVEVNGPFAVLPTGSVPVDPGATLYPPITLVLFLPALLPAMLWWLIPIGVTIVAIAALRPEPWSWLLMALCLFPAQSVELVIAGNLDIWLVAFLALSLRWRPASALLLLKPSVFPFALLGIRDRRWWAVAGIFALVSLATWPLTMDWFHVVLNVQGQRSGFLHSFGDFPLLAVPLVAYLGRARSDPRTAEEPLGLISCGGVDSAEQ